MKKEEILTKLKNNVASVIKTVKDQSLEYLLAPKGIKWTNAEHIIHLTLSVKALNVAYSIPKILVLLKFGKYKGDHLDYDALVTKYKNLDFPARTGFEPKKLENPSKEIILRSFEKNHAFYIEKLSKFSEKELDKYQLKHPVMGNLSMREFAYFMIHHIDHHHKAIITGQ
jgi:hypothetical protein